MNLHVIITSLRSSQLASRPRPQWQDQGQGHTISKAKKRPKHLALWTKIKA